MIVCIGEVLFDQYAERTADGFKTTAKIGGAPYNVAKAVKALGGRNGFIGCVGNDTFGDAIFEIIKKQSFDELLLTRDLRRNTPFALVSSGKGGERSFTFYARDTADLYPPKIPRRTFKRANIIHIGSLLLRTDRGRKTAAKIAETARAEGCLVSFDLNYRPTLFHDKEAAFAALKDMAMLADLVKMSEEEADAVGEEFLAALPKEKLVCVTLGEKGCKWSYAGMSGQIPSIEVEAVDTTGAGDAFWAAVLVELDGKKRPLWTADFLNAAFKRANVCGALTATHKGASSPSLRQLNARLRKIERR